MMGILCSYFQSGSRRAIVTGLTVAFALSSVVPTLAQTRGTELLITNGDQVQKILDALDDSVWLADGPQADTHVYVIFNTACGFSKKLFADSRSLPDRPQFRWVTFDSKGYGAEMVLTKRTVESLADAFAGKHIAPANMTVADFAISINRSIYLALPENSQLVYPMLVYKTPQGLRITYGAPPNIRTLKSAVQGRSERSVYKPASMNWITSPPIITGVPMRIRQWFNTSNTAIPVRLAPYPQAPIISEIEKNHGGQPDGIANDEWIRIPFLTLESGTKIYGYIKAATDIKLATFEFSVQPVSGVVETGNSTVEIRSLPTKEAPIIDTVGPGYRLKTSGEVRLEGGSWVEVIVYTDGTKGYIAK
jgi:hypothetical protein